MCSSGCKISCSNIVEGIFSGQEVSPREGAQTKDAAEIEIIDSWDNVRRHCYLSLERLTLVTAIRVQERDSPVRKKW